MSKYIRYPKSPNADPLLYRLAEAAEIHPGVIYHHAMKMASLISQGERPR